MSSSSLTVAHLRVGVYTFSVVVLRLHKDFFCFFDRVRAKGAKNVPHHLVEHLLRVVCHATRLYRLYVGIARCCVQSVVLRFLPRGVWAAGALDRPPRFCSRFIVDDLEVSPSLAFRHSQVLLQALIGVMGINRSSHHVSDNIIPIPPSFRVQHFLSKPIPETEHFVQEQQVLPLRPLQGNGFHQSGHRAQIQGEGYCRRDRQPRRKSRRFLHSEGKKTSIAITFEHLASPTCFHGLVRCKRQL